MEVGFRHGVDLLASGNICVYVICYICVCVYAICYVCVSHCLSVSLSHTLYIICTAPSHLQYEPWWVKGRGHNDVLQNNEKEFIR